VGTTCASPGYTSGADVFLDSYALYLVVPLYLHLQLLFHPFHNSNVFLRWCLLPPISFPHHCATSQLDCTPDARSQPHAGFNEWPSRRGSMVGARYRSGHHNGVLPAFIAHNEKPAIEVRDRSLRGRATVFLTISLLQHYHW